MLIAGVGPRVLDRVLEHGDGWLPLPLFTAEQLGAHRRTARPCRRSGPHSAGHPLRRHPRGPGILRKGRGRPRPVRTPRPRDPGPGTARTRSLRHIPALSGRPCGTAMRRHPAPKST
ncbi:hypothetical protein B0T44_08730 [Nocardia donostiensis]|uniref:Uncharacterized protein n=1 Tax=Nocardia donostiensis TaxID=1538463 RepID=A0A1W0BF18_9NOCA|nr:hypothetical protein B0T46_18800 [Nocardia donostiensis]OQS16617.1 hypothetical protein B0T36_02750 [Nocardia donostiensis]OQS21094.1 hypothetical protein B0T44_08730 [Nocardia donostiensis]